jgi:hypothetical protein
MGASPLGVPTGSPGGNANALSQVREAIKILEKALPDLPTGSDPYKAVLSAIQSVSRHVTPSAEVPGVQQTTLRNMQQSAQQSGMLQSLMRSLGGAGAAGSPGGMGLPAPSGGPPTPGGLGAGPGP